MRRKSMSMGKSKKVFVRGAVNVHPKNNLGTPMRGGIRL